MSPTPRSSARSTPAVFARAYGLVVPACVAGIAGGALLAPPCVALLGLDATLVVTGTLVLAYGALGFVRPAVSGPQPGRSTWLTQPSA